MAAHGLRWIGMAATLAGITAAALAQINGGAASQPMAEKKLSFPFGEGVGHGDGICIPVKLGGPAGKEHLFLVDTGSATVFDSALAGPGGVLGQPAGERQVADALGKPAKIQLYRAPALIAGGETLRMAGDGFIETTDLSMLRTAAQRPIEGILGCDVLENYVVRLDFRGRTLDLIEPSTFAPLPPSIKQFEMILVGGGPGIMADFAGVPGAAAMLDTGMIFEGGISGETFTKLGAEATTRPGSWIAAAGGMVEVPEARIARKWALGQTRYENLWLDRTQLNLIGLGIMSDFVVTFDFSTSHVYLESLRADHAPRGAPLGFGLGASKGRVLITTPGPGAVQAGLSTGDELISIDGRPIAGMEFWRVMDTLRQSPQRRITIRRGGENRDVTLGQNP